jgi:Protein of unknown function (DUF3455)
MQKMVTAFAVVCAAVAALASGARTEAAHCVRPPVVPDALKVPGVREPKLRLPATGVQIYTCSSDEAGAYVWKFKAPEATLFSESGRRVGDHFAGPTWRLRDGSKVVGRLLAKADAPEAGAVPWLLLEIADNSGRGALADAHFIQRVHTSGGVAPSEGCDATTVGTDARVDYSADYYFW